MTLRAVVEIVMTGLILVSAAAIMAALGRALRKSASGAGSSALFSVIAAAGDAFWLEHTVRSLLRRKTHGRILIADYGLNEQSRRVAQLLAEDSVFITLCYPGELPSLIGSLEENHGLRVSDT